jgi:hypothetical protein
VLLEVKEVQVQQVHKVRLEVKALLGLQDPKEQPELQEHREPLVHRALLEQQVYKESKVLLVTLVLQVVKEPQERKELLGHKVLLELKVPQEQLGLLVYKV